MPTDEFDEFDNSWKYVHSSIKKFFAVESKQQTTFDESAQISFVNPGDIVLVAYGVTFRASARILAGSNFGNSKGFEVPTCVEWAFIPDPPFGRQVWACLLLTRPEKDKLEFRIGRKADDLVQQAPEEVPDSGLVGLMLGKLKPLVLKTLKSQAHFMPLGTSTIVEQWSARP